MEQSNNTWTIITEKDLKRKDKVIPSILNFRVKTNSNGKIKKYKSWMAVRGDLKIYSGYILRSSSKNNDFEKFTLFSSIPSRNLDVPNAYKKARIPNEKRIIITPPPGFNQLLNLPFQKKSI